MMEAMALSVTSDKDVIKLDNQDKKVETKQ